ncbi:76_t:CDS:2 [Gigaspora margarita]|uniref:76_t:CDS:1 n=1 Tax=Gigaspora margarita TaxID=4874 RepID=A0ABN7V195_GIGMA|nr:76_t:CDS:2 [Gigaspora margarita]
MADPNTTKVMVALLARIGVEGIQQQNQVNVENIENVYPLLDISGVSRYHTHQHILEELKNKFIQAIITEHWNQEKCKYPDRITEEIYEQLAREPTIIHEAPIEIKRGLYERDQEMFKEIIKTQIDNYFKSQSLIMQQRGTNSDILNQRTNIPELKYIIDLVNESSILFDEMQNIMSEIYKDNGHSNICSFRLDFFNCMQKAGKISKNLTVKWIFTMVTLGSKSHEILRLNNAIIPRVDERIYSSFCEKLLYWIYEDNERALETARIISQEIHEDSEDVPNLNLIHKFGTNEINILKNNDFTIIEIYQITTSVHL